MTDLFEGSIIRCLRRLDELLKQMEEAAKVIGNKELENKFKESSKKLKKGIVFAASLYLWNNVYIYNLIMTDKNCFEPICEKEDILNMKPKRRSKL